MRRDIRVWDPLVRIGHWTIFAAFTIAYFTEDDLLTVHVWAGYVVGAAVAFRIVWGFVGSERARFSDFVYSPRAVLSYLSDLIRLRARRYLGHSPAGGAMVLVLLAMLAGTVTTGLMAYGADKKAGPLAPLYAAKQPASAASELVVRGGHREKGARSDESAGTARGAEESAIGELHDLLANLTLILVLLHVSGVALASIVHRENLVAAMITGRKRAEIGLREGGARSRISRA